MMRARFGIEFAIGMHALRIVDHEQVRYALWEGYCRRALAGERFSVYEEEQEPMFYRACITLNPIMDGDSVVGVACFTQDVTAQRISERELERSYREVRISELQKSAILDALPANIALLDQQGTIVAVNARWRAFADANGYTGEGHGVGSNYLHIARQATGQEADMGLIAAEVIKRSLSDQLAEFSTEYPCDSPTEPRWFRMQVSPLASQCDGGTVVMHMDITARKMAEEQLIRSEATMAQAQAIAHFGSWELNLDDVDNLAGPDAHPHGWSDEFYRILGLDPGSVAVSMENFFDFVHPDDRSRVSNALEATIGRVPHIPWTTGSCAPMVLCVGYMRKVQWCMDRVRCAGWSAPRWTSANVDQLMSGCFNSIANWKSAWWNAQRNWSWRTTTWKWRSVKIRSSPA